MSSSVTRTGFLLLGIVLALFSRRDAAAGTPADAGSSELFRAEEILRLADSVYTYTLDHPHTKTDRNWIRATFYSGVMELYGATGNPAYRDRAVAWATRHAWQVGTEASGMNRLFCAMTWVDLYLLDPDPKKIAPTLQWLATDAPNSPGGGAAVWFGHAPAPYSEPVYSDSLYGAPVFAMLYKATGDKQHLETLNHVWWTVTDAILDREEQLYYRDARYIAKKSPAGKKVLWSRGNGWVFAGLPRVLKHLPKDDPAYPRFLKLYQDMASSLATRQQADGFWRSNLADPWHYRMPESSGTAFFTAGFAWGVRTGALDRETYLPVVIRGWKALTEAVHPSGKLGWVQPVDAEPRPSQPETTQEYAVGPLLTAAGELYRLVKDGTITSEIVQAALPRQTGLLPPPALKLDTITEADHPLHRQIRAFLVEQGKRTVKPTGLTRADYLDIIARQVRAMHGYQDASGRIIDPVEKREKHFATPCYAHSVAVLVEAGHSAGRALRESGMQALDVALEDMALGKAADRHGDFYTWPALWAYQSFRSVASRERVETWKQRLAGIDPAKLYAARRVPITQHRRFYDEYLKRALPDTGPYGNWTVVNLAGEYSRHRLGLTGLAYVDYNLTMQLPRFTPLGMYSERGNPLAYDLFPRHYLTGMLRRGYRSFLHGTYRDLLWRGAWTSLFMQSPFGELPTGYRSAHHLWNEAQQAVVFEIHAAACAQAGRFAEASAFKRGARLALQSVRCWTRPDGSGYVVKNRYPIEMRHGYETYTTHTAYNLLTCSMLAQAWTFANDDIPEAPCPADVGGFAFCVARFHKVFANVGGNYIEYDTRGDGVYNPTGLIRVHLKGGHPQLGPSDGTASKFSGRGNAYAVGPAWQNADGTWHRLAELKDHASSVEIVEQGPQRVRVRIEHRLPPHDGEAVRLIETIVLDREKVQIEAEVRGAGIQKMRLYWPMLVFDGMNETDVAIDGATAQLTLNGRTQRFIAMDPGAKLVRTGKRFAHRNGEVELVYSELNGTRAKVCLSAGER